MERNSVFRNAFMNARVITAQVKNPLARQREVTGAAIINKVAKVLSTKAGLIRERDWNARLSFKTAKLIGMPECTNPMAYGPKGQPSMAYDEMVRG